MRRGAVGRQGILARVFEAMQIIAIKVAALCFSLSAGQAADCSEGRKLLARPAQLKAVVMDRASAQCKGHYCGTDQGFTTSNARIKLEHLRPSALME